jgi:dephospho-CoA kinase
MTLPVAVVITPPREAWPTDFRTLAEELGAAPGLEVMAIDHIGSTAVPGLPAKDVIDAQVIVRSLAPREHILGALAAVGFVQRPGDWNLRDHIPLGWVGDDREWDKLVFGPRHGHRPSNVHLRAAGSSNERYALLFRDYLLADPAARRAWGEFKTRLAAIADDRESYGQVKDPASDIVMLAADPWAAATSWTVAKSRSAG